MSRRNTLVCVAILAVVVSSCARKQVDAPDNSRRVAIGRIEIGMRLDDVERVVKLAGGTEAHMEIMAAPGSNVTVRSYAFEPQTVVSIAAQPRAEELRVTSIEVYRDVDKAKADRHSQNVARLDIP